MNDFQSITGKGIEGYIDGKKINVVSSGYVKNEKLPVDESKLQTLSKAGKTVVFLLSDDAVVGMIALTDIVRETAKEAIEKLKDQGIHTVMLAGDNKNSGKLV